MSFNLRFVLIIFTFFPVNLISLKQFSTNGPTNIVDLSQNCTNNYSLTVLLSSGRGSTDSKVILLRSSNSFSRTCSILIQRLHFMRDECLVIVVLELFNYDPRYLLCKTGNEITTYENGSKSLCPSNTNNTEEHHQIQSFLMPQEEISILFDFTNYSGTIKVTATTAISFGQEQECNVSQIYCKLYETALCIDEIFQCDGHLNCGSPNLFDEFCQIPLGENIVFTVLYASFLVASLIIFLTQALRKCTPKVSGRYFVFNDGDEYNLIITSQLLPPLRTIFEKNKDQTDSDNRNIGTQIY